MKTKSYTIIILLIIFINSSIYSQNRNGVTPMPLKLEWDKGCFPISKTTSIHTNLKGSERKRLETWLKQSSVFGNNNLCNESNSNESGIILHKIPLQLFEQNAEIPGKINNGAYILDVSPQKIFVTSPTDTGLFHALQSIIQLIESTDNDTLKVPAVHITDVPRFDYRGFMIDVSRHFRSKEFLKKQIDAMARYKMNYLHLHLTDAAGWRIEIKQFPKLTDFAAWRSEAAWKDWWNKDNGRKYCDINSNNAYGGFYTQLDIQDIVQYAADRHITIIPEIEMPSHSEEVLAAYPELSCSGKPYINSDFCISNDSVFNFLEQVLLEVMNLFPSQYIHIGGDEASKEAWKTCVKCQKRLKELHQTDVTHLQNYMIQRIYAFLKKHNRKLLGWDEILNENLPEDAAIMSWRSEEMGFSAAQSFHPVIMTPGKYCYLDSYQDAPITQPEAISGYLPLSKVYSYNPAPDTLSTKQAEMIMGVQGNLWAESIPSDTHYEYMTYPRLLAIAEIGWTMQQNKSYTDFLQRALHEVEWLNRNGYNTFQLKNEHGERSESKSPVNHLALNKPVTYNTPYHNAYKANGDLTLTDGKRGGWTYNDGAWQGFISRNQLDVTIDLETIKSIEQIYADFIQVVNPEVFLPYEVIISISDDGKNFTEIMHETYTVTKQQQISFQKYGWKGNARTRFIRFQAHSDPNLKNWIFTDEIIVL